MSQKYKIYQVDAFTTERFKGNPAGVVPNADGLTRSKMQLIAREMNNSETAFMFSPNAGDHDVRIRFFTPRTEVPSCGHATVAAHYTRARQLNLGSVTVMHKLPIGILPVEIVRIQDDYQINMVQGKPEFLHILDEREIALLLSALKIKAGDLLAPVPVQVVSTGHSKVMIGLNNSEILNRLRPDFNALIELSTRIDCKGYYVFTVADFKGRQTARARMFAPAIGINEDPVNGNGSGPLCAYLVKYGLAKHDGGTFELPVFMGDVLDRPGIVRVSVSIVEGEPAIVKIGGRAVVAFGTEIEI